MKNKFEEKSAKHSLAQIMELMSGLKKQTDERVKPKPCTDCR